MDSAESFEWRVSALPAPKRADAALSEHFKERVSRSEIQALLKNGGILLNGKPAKPSALIKEGDVLAGRLGETAKKTTLEPENIPLTIVHEDEDILVVDKAVGMVVHPGAAAKKGTLVNALLGRGTRLSSMGASTKDRPGIVHRLDKDTSGLLVVAKNNRAHRLLQDQFEARSITKIYTALVRGQVDFEEGHVDESLERDAKVRRKMAVARRGGGKEALTRYRVVRRFKSSTLLEVRILTGRTHQIRVHLAHLGHPVLGDELYGKKESAPRLCLHASKIEFLHPKTGKMMRFESPLPPDFEAAISSQERSV